MVSRMTGVVELGLAGVPGSVVIALLLRPLAGRWLTGELLTLPGFVEMALALRLLAFRWLSGEMCFLPINQKGALFLRLLPELGLL